MKSCEIDGQLMLFVLEPSGKTTVKPPKQKASTSALVSIPYFHLDLSKDHVDIFGCHYWELRSPWREDGPPLNTGVAPRNPVRCSLSEILEPAPHRKYYLSKDACLGILRRARERGKELPPQLREALMAQAGLKTWTSHQLADPVAFAANQRDEVRDLHDVAGALGAQPGMKQQTFIAENCLNPWDTQQARVFTTEGKAPTLAGADGGGGRNPAGLLFAAGFCAGASPAAGNIGYQEEISPTLRGSPSGNMMPSVLCLNDQGGSVMDCTENITGTLRAQEHGHQPLVFENHGIDARYTGPHPVSPTLSARAGTGGNNLPLALQADEVFCITGNAIDRKPQNGGNGIGYQTDIAYTLTATDHHAVFSRQRVDVFKDNEVVSTESARQYKDATDLVYQETVGTLTSSDRKGPNSQYVGQDKLIVDGPLLIRRLTPLECERLQGFPDGWTDLPGASDSARYKALGNSVAIPCVEFIMRGIAMAIACT
nr:DNA cytosine methyltransferase [uncultured Oscillibacter sp.]